MPPPPLRARPGALPSWRTLKAIADAQRLVNGALLAGIVVFPAIAILGAQLRGAGPAVGLLLLVAAAAFVIWLVLANYRLARALGSKVAVLWAVGSLVPNLIGLIVMAILSSRASRRLKQAGIKVGFLGVKLGDRPPPGFLCEELTQEFS